MSTGRQKAPSQLQRRDGRVKDLPVPIEPKPAPRMPAGLSPGAKAVWRKFWSSPLSHAVDPEADYNRLQRWMELLSERDELRDRIYGSEWAPPDEIRLETADGVEILLGSDTLQALADALGVRPMGKSGLTSRLNAVEVQILRLEESFGISPQARFRLQIRYETAQEKAGKRRERYDAAPVVPDPSETIVDLDKL